MKKTLFLFVWSVSLAFCVSCSKSEDVSPTPPPGNPTNPTNPTNPVDNPPVSVYKKNLVYVVGDVKQALIQNKVTTQAQADNLLKGFKTMNVNGLRFPIYPKGEDPNPIIHTYLFNEAVKQGFRIFSNPALHNGGQRIANELLDGENLGGPVKGNDLKTQVLINRIKEYAAGNKCTWICPFNEDGAPDKTWSVAQINRIFKDLKGNMNGAELIGPCGWGVPASTDVLEQTEIEKYITVATSHNLGYNHAAWTDFKTAAGILPKWDSEVNHNTDHENPVTRIQAAMAADLNGLVLYNSWQYINLTDGSVNTAGKTVMTFYLK